MGLSEIHVRLNGDGTGKVHVNGHEVPGVLAVRVEGASREIPHTLLKIQGPVEVEGLGVAEATSSEDGIDFVRELDAILADIDPKLLDREVLEGAGLGDSGGGASEYLAAVRRFVRGD